MFHVEHCTAPRFNPGEGKVGMSTTNPKSKPRLGRGLSSLMAATDLPIEVEVDPPAETAPGPVQPDAGSAEVSVTGTLDIPVADICPNPHQPRRQFDEASLMALAA